MTVKKQTIKKSTLMPTALISGGAGFIGSHLAESLLSNNARVIVLDNYRTGKDVHIKHLLNEPNFAFYNVDINAGIPDEIESVDYIIHLAGLEEYLYSKEYVNLDSLLTNSSGTKNLLDLAKASESKFLMVSTIDVYQGRMSQIDLNKYFGKDSFDENKFSLTEAKRFSEALVWEYFKKFDMDARVVRLPEVYGPRMNLDASGSLGGFLKDVINSTDITIYGDGFEKEYYLYVSDVVAGLVKALFSPNTKGNIYSLVPETSVSALEVAYMVRKMADGEVNVLFKQRMGEEPQQLRVPDQYNLRDLDWRARIDMVSGIKKTLEWFGYSVNQNQFKPAKFIQNKIDNVAPPQVAQKISYSAPTAEPPKVEKTQELFSISSQFQSSPQLKEVAQAITKNPLTKVKIPRIRLPNISLAGKSGLFLKVFSVVIAAFIVFIAVPASVLVYSSYSGLQSLKKVETSVGNLDTKTLLKESSKASKQFTSAKKSFSSLKWVLSLFQGKEKAQTYEKILYSVKYFSDAVGQTGLAIGPAQELLTVLRPDNNKSLDPGVVDAIKLNLSQAEKYVALARSEFAGIKPGAISEKFGSRLSLYQNFLVNYADGLKLVSSLVSGYPGIVGADGEKNYIVWFQNSNEIRPTGGFIGSYGILKFNDGKLNEVVIDDIYNPDGQIGLRNIVVSPPQPIIDYLKEDRLYLRNSNWNPDFAQSAKEFDNLYFKVTGSKIDGYIALDLFFVKGLLKVTGPVFLAAYNEEISAENLYERTQFHSDFNYQDGSDQKRSFLTVLGSKLLEKLFTLPEGKFLDILKEVNNSLEQRHLLVYFSNNEFNALLKQYGWDGGLAETQTDYLYVVNSNLGGTKANYYVKNKMKYEIASMTRDGLLRANLYLEYNHTGKDQSWPGGPYKDYLRVLTQSGSKLTGAKMIRDDGEAENIFDNVVIAKEGAFNSFELGFTLDPQKKLRIELSYDLPQKLSMTKEFSDYNLYWQKQPGTEGDEFEFIFHPPFGMAVQSFSSGLKMENGLLSNSGIIESDSSYFVKLQ